LLGVCEAVGGLRSSDFEERADGGAFRLVDFRGRLALLLSPL